MKKYKVLKSWDGVEVGEILENNNWDNFEYTCFVSNNKRVDTEIEPHEIALLLHAGFIEEVGQPWVPQMNERYWYIDGAGDVFHTHWRDHINDVDRKKFDNIYRTQEEAQAIAALIQAFVKKQRDNSFIPANEL